ncbi:MAG: hypothetical protein J2P48_23220 [Alphaproteobacteria bacterium]|nr:hypothetical protein [Alphaproteobacteria bacterium]
MVIKSATYLAFTAACLTAIATLPAAQAQMEGPSGNPPPAYGNPPPPAPPPQEQVMTNQPQTSPGDFGTDRAARQNIIASRHYDRLLKTNRAFREARKVKECGPIADSDLRSSCLASFDHYTPYVGGPTVTGYGSSGVPRHHRYRSGYGR